MNDLTRESEPLTNFKRNSSRILDELKATGMPLVLTINGKEELIVQDVAAYRRLLEGLEAHEATARVREGLADVAAGRTRPMREALEELGRKHAIPKV